MLNARNVIAAVIIVGVLSVLSACIALLRPPGGSGMVPSIAFFVESIRRCFSRAPQEKLAKTVMEKMPAMSALTTKQMIAGPPKTIDKCRSSPAFYP